MPEQKLQPPILFLIFNRPDTTQAVFNEIRKARPAQLFIAADGPRRDRPDDLEICRKAREIIRQVDWDCKVSTLFRDENLGCKIGVSSAIDWFFSHVEEGIILEDDCVPDQSFFPFCQELLKRYRDDERVMMITGTNYLFLNYEMNESYFFSKYYIIWGWATWKRAWEMYDITMRDWPQYQESSQLEWIYSDKNLINWYNVMFQMAYQNKIDTWDIQWWYSCIFQNGLCIVPKYNLISNIGEFGHFSRGGTYNEYIRMPTKSVDFNAMIHPSHVVENGIFDRVTINKLFIEKFPHLHKIVGGIAYYYSNLKAKLTHIK
jgi:hypothetical protein